MKSPMQAPKFPARHLSLRRMIADSIICGLFVWMAAQIMTCDAMAEFTVLGDTELSESNPPRIF